MAHAVGYNSARSTGVHEMHRHRTVDRPVDRCREAVDGPTDRLKGAKSRLETVDRRGRPWHGSVDRPARFDFPFGIQIPFLDEIESNLGFLKSRNFVVINRD